MWLEIPSLRISSEVSMVLPSGPRSVLQLSILSTLSLCSAPCASSGVGVLWKHWVAPTHPGSWQPPEQWGMCESVAGRPPAWQLVPLGSHWRAKLLSAARSSQEQQWPQGRTVVPLRNTFPFSPPGLLGRAGTQYFWLQFWFHTTWNYNVNNQKTGF